MSRPATADDGRSSRQSHVPLVFFAVAVASGLMTTVALWTERSDTWVGLALAACLGSIGVGLVTWAKDLPIDREVVQQRHDLARNELDRAQLVEEQQLTASTLGRRPALGYLLGGALAALGAAVLSPLRFLGPAPGDERRRTSWRAGRRVVSADGRPVVAASGRQDQLVTVFPEDNTDADDSQVVLLRLPTEVLSAATIEGGAVDGWVAYSKICTHAGCSVGLFGVDDRGPDVVRQLVCPCHQSVFDPTDAARPVGGPAPRPLPQLPLAIDDDGHLVARADFGRPVGPATWDDR